MSSEPRISSKLGFGDAFLVFRQRMASCIRLVYQGDCLCCLSNLVASLHLRDFSRFWRDHFPLHLEHGKIPISLDCGTNLTKPVKIWPEFQGLKYARKYISELRLLGKDYQWEVAGQFCRHYRSSIQKASRSSLPCLIQPWLGTVGYCTLIFDIGAVKTHAKARDSR